MMTNSQSDTFLMGLDLGTSAIKGIVIDIHGNEIASTEKQISYTHPQNGWVNADPQQYYQDVCLLIRELVANSGNISALAMAAASGNTLLTDKDGHPLTSIINWMDERATQDLPDIIKNIPPAEVHQIVGWPCIDQFPLAHLAWLRENETSLFKEAEHYCMNTDWLLFKLTGKWVMDHSTATTFHLQDQTVALYHKPFLNMLDISEDKLSTLVNSGTKIGKLTPQAIKDTGLSPETSVISGCFDHPAAARSTGIINPGQLLLSCGTSWVGFFPELDRQKIIDAGLLCDPFLSESNGLWGAIFSVPGIGKTINWYIDNLIAPGETDKMKVFNEAAAEANSGADGLSIDLLLTPKAIDAKRANISRAIMESAARLLNEKIEELKSKGIAFNRATMVGGPSKSPIWPHIVEEITGIKLTVGSSHAGAKGAALLAGIGCKVYADEHDALKQTSSASIELTARN